MFTRVPVPKTGHLGMDFQRVALTSCRTADDALEQLIELTEGLTQGGRMGHLHRSFRYHSSFLIAGADPKQSWRDHRVRIDDWLGRALEVKAKHTPLLDSLVLVSTIAGDVDSRLAAVLEEPVRSPGRRETGVCRRQPGRNWRMWTPSSIVQSAASTPPSQPVVYATCSSLVHPRLVRAVLRSMLREARVGMTSRIAPWPTDGEILDRVDRARVTRRGTPCIHGLWRLTRSVQQTSTLTWHCVDSADSPPRLQTVRATARLTIAVPERRSCLACHSDSEHETAV